MKLDARLRAVAKFVAQARADSDRLDDNKVWTHIDIGSDHGHLLQVLLEKGTITKAIAVEKNEAPLKRTQKALNSFNAECFLGDGFAPLKENSSDSASICGLGASTILQILQAYPEKLPKRLVLQANKHSEKLRRWGYEQGYHLIDECMVYGFWNYAILLFEQIQDVDDAYESERFSLETQFKYGPHLLKRRDPLLLQTIESELEHFRGMKTGNDAVGEQIRRLEQLLSNF